MKSMYDVSDATSYGFMYDLICNEHRYAPANGHRVLDLGAHYGFFSLFCAARGATVVAYEPDPDNFERLENASSLACDNKDFGKIEIHNTGVWVSEHRLPLHRDHHSGTSNIIGIGNSRNIEIQVIPFSDALSEYEWDCVKMDIEGAEFEILAQCAPQDLQRIKFLTLEMHPHLFANPKPLYDAAIKNLEEIFVVEKYAPYQDCFCKIFCTRK